MAKKKETGTTVTVSGITVDVHMDAADDFELVEQIAVNADPDSTAAERISAMVRVYKAIFGRDYKRVKDELRRKNGGRLPVAVMSDFATTVMNEVAKLKNSAGSDTSSGGTE